MTLENEYLLEVSKKKWPSHNQKNLWKVYRSKNYFIQVFKEAGNIRITVNKTAHSFDSDGNPAWEDNISWDDIQEIKNRIGFASEWAVECYPPKDKVVNVANMRHIWIIPTPDFGWH